MSQLQQDLTQRRYVCKAFWIAIGLALTGLLMAGGCSSGDGTLTPTRVYQDSFDSEASLENWVMEGPGVATIDDGRLLLYSKWLPELESLEEENDVLGIQGDHYYRTIEQWVKEREPENLVKYLRDPENPSTFKGGHLQLWNKQVHPDNFLIRIKFQPANPNPLHMVTFAALGVGGESIFDPKLASRFGIGGQYMSGDLTNYRISYWSGQRSSAHMRRAPGRQLTSQQNGDVPREALDSEVQLEIYGWQGRFVFKCDRETLIDWTDPEPLSGGYFSIRLMLPAKGWYDDYEVYALNANPFED